MSYSLNSGLKIFKLIQVLWETPETREEICGKLFELGIEAEPKTVSKYIKTLKEAGFEIITKKGQNYEIIKTPLKINLKEDEALGYSVLIEILKTFSNNKKSLFQYKLENLTTSDAENIETIKYGFDEETFDVYNKLTEYIYNPSKISFSYFGKKILAIPIKIKYGSKKIYIFAFNLHAIKTEKFELSNIRNMEFVSSAKPQDFDFFPKTIFKIKGDLIKSYILKEGEVAKYKDKEVQVTNYYEEKDELFKRLMRYGKNCEIIYPEEDRKKFIQMVGDLIEHYKSM